jgi:predicted phage baseplate assembly protein
VTPVALYNRAGLDALAYRVGTQAQFFETMLAQLSTTVVEGLGPDGQTVETLRPLQALTTRDTRDLSIALLDGWATVADVLTFYQERIANEGFLRTATERRSVLELAGLVGYALRPGVAATAYLAYTLDEKQAERVTIAAGARSQSSPGPGETPQSFETSEDLEARSQWNNLQVRVRRAPDITLTFPPPPADDADLSVATMVAGMQAAGNVLVTSSIPVAGAANNLRPGDKLLFRFGAGSAQTVVRSVADVDPAFAEQQTLVTLVPVDPTLAASTSLLATTVAAADPKAEFTQAALAILDQALLGLPGDPAGWVTGIADSLEANPPPAFALLDKEITQLLGVGPGGGGPPVTNTGLFVKGLLTARKPQVANSLQLVRNLGASFGANADAGSQLMVHFAPAMQETFYRALSGATVNGKAGPLENVYVLRARTGLFGAGVSMIPAFYGDNDAGHIPGTIKPQNEWTDDWDYVDEADDNAFLDQAVEAIGPGSYVLAHVQGADPERQVLHVTSAAVAPRSAYGVSGPATALTFDTKWRATQSDGVTLEITDLRRTQIYAQSEALTLVDAPIEESVGGQQIELDGVYDGLTAGRWVIVSGERTDIPGVKGVKTAELMMLANVSQGFDATAPGDQVHTTLTLATPLAYTYKRSTLKIYGNVVKATNGETCPETLGSGDGAQSLQSFTLKRPPLTFVAAPNPRGVDSTLHVYVDNVEWHEVDSLAGLPPQQRAFVTSNDDDANTELTFGNGLQGARLPTGVQNVTARYRTGIGAGGNVRARQINLLLTRPLGVTEVVNPLPASGGSDKEPRDLARENAPLSVLPLDRLVSVTDYADFTRSFAGVAKAIAARISDGKQQLVYLTIAGADDVPIDPTSDLYRNLLLALRRLGDPDLPIRVDTRELVALVLSAGVKLLPDYQWEPVASEIRARLLDAFGFGKRALGQPALRCEVITVIQSVRGVAYVDVDAFGGVPERKVGAGADGKRELLTPDDIAAAVAAIVDPKRDDDQDERVDPFPGGLDHGVLRPAQVAILTEAVPATLVLNQRT